MKKAQMEQQAGGDRRKNHNHGDDGQEDRVHQPDALRGLLLAVRCIHRCRVARQRVVK